MLVEFTCGGKLALNQCMDAGSRPLERIEKRKWIDIREHLVVLK
jgi:hypothetical protein